jgi:hypothetical protein
MACLPTLTVSSFLKLDVDSVVPQFYEYDHNEWLMDRILFGVK